jgi:hypothetical protein
MLSQEDRSKLSESELAVAFAQAAGAARALGQSLPISRNPDPMPERNAPNPAHPGATVIRIIRPRPRTVVVEDIARVTAHNEYVSSLGRSGRKFE